jgi:hypothetical protein
MATGDGNLSRYEPADIMEALYGDGIISQTGIYEVALIDRMRASIENLFTEVHQVEDGALPRGPERWYVEVAPESIDGFVEIASHPWFLL